jgi:putative sterol carrier protein
VSESTIAEFVEGLGAGEHRRLGGAAGTVRVELENGDKIDRFFLVLQDGRVRSSRKRMPFDATLRTSRETFAGLIRGDVNALTALLRGELAIEGNTELLVLLQRFFPGPPGAREPRRGVAASGRRR